MIYSNTNIDLFDNVAMIYSNTNIDFFEGVQVFVGFVFSSDSRFAWSNFWFATKV